MNISRINNNQNFTARLCGDLRQVIAISKEGGLSEKAVNKLLKEVPNILPDKNDRVFFIFRKPYYEDFWHDFMLRSQIEVFKNGDVFNNQGLRANIYPFKGEQKDLLSNFVQTLKKLVKSEIPTEKTRYFYPEKKHLWMNNYRYDQRLKTGWVNYDEGLEI